jgi:hypothetical protein
MGATLSVYQFWFWASWFLVLICRKDRYRCILARAVYIAWNYQIYCEV